MRAFTWVVIPLLSVLIPTFMIYTSSPYVDTVNFVGFQPLPKIELEGVLAKNEKLTSIKRLGEGKLDAPESITFDREGNIYASTADGNIMRIFAKNESVEIFARVGGRPLGLAFDNDNNLIVCEPLKGLISIHPETRKVTILASHVGDSPITFPNDVEVTKNGKIYFSDSTNIGLVHKNHRWISLTPSLVACVSGDPQGRLLEYDPSTKTTRVLMDGLVYANGVTLSKDEDYILIAESGKPSIHRYYLSGPKAGKSDYFVENLPGIPDGLATGKDGKFYVCFFSMRSPVEALHPYPFAKKVLTTLLPLLPPLTKKTAFVGVLDQNANFVETLWDPTGKVATTVTDLHEHDGKLYMGSLVTPWISVYDLKKSSAINSLHSLGSSCRFQFQPFCPWWLLQWHSLVNHS
eukprot:Phypoly_transcript_09479.p1 GENE.Phypoly_transcript_09479~~Phypoly_transcript_09479.p1  ORF type:complete len:406 (+),score=50.89 Phypoly_transcript_09479:72-1289(+)